MIKIPYIREILVGITACGLLIVGTYFGWNLAKPKQSDQYNSQNANVNLSQTWEDAFAEGRLALRDFDGDAHDEVIYFPQQGPPAIFAQVNGEYNPNNSTSETVYKAAMQMGGILASNYDMQMKKALIAQLEREVPASFHSLVAYAVLQDPNAALTYQNRLYAAKSASSLITELYQTTRLADLIFDNPKSAVTTGLVMIGARLLQNSNFVYTGPPSYAQWTKSGPGWEDVGTIDSSGMVKVSPGSWVSIRNKEALKRYEDLRKDQNVIYTSSGFIRLEHPIGESRADYYKRTDQESARRNAAVQQRQQLNQSVQQTYQQWSSQVQQTSHPMLTQVQQWNQQLGNQAQQFQQNLNQQINNWDKQIQNWFNKK